MDFVFKMMNFVSKMMSFVFKMMRLMQISRRERAQYEILHSGPRHSELPDGEG